jgi:glycosyltransferase involved in cell wall biosynthesis
MKILFLSSHFGARKSSGGVIRDTAILNYLCRYHEVYLGATTFNYIPVESCTRFRQLLPIKNMFVFTSENRFVNADQDIGSLENLIQEINPDIIWAHEKMGLRRVGFPSSIPVILDLVDVPWRKLWRTFRHEKGLNKISIGLKTIKYFIEDNIFASKAYRVAIANDQEKKYILSKKNIYHIPNGYTFPEDIQVRNNLEQKLLFVGALFYYPNVQGIEWFCQKIWPIIYKRSPGASIEIVGDISSQANKLDYLKKIPGVNLHGFVEDIDPYLSKSAALVVPLQTGGGTRIKIIEAWSKGLPVVSTAIGCEGLGAKNGETLLIADRPEEFADACIKLLNDPEKGKIMAQKAFEWSKNIYDWKVILPRIPDMLENV